MSSKGTRGHVRGMQTVLTCRRWPRLSTCCSFMCPADRICASNRSNRKMRSARRSRRRSTQRHTDPHAPAEEEPLPSTCVCSFCAFASASAAPITCCSIGFVLRRAALALAVLAEPFRLPIEANCHAVGPAANNRKSQCVGCERSACTRRANRSAALEPFARPHRCKRSQIALLSVASVAGESATAEEHPASVEARTVHCVVAGGQHGLAQADGERLHFDVMRRRTEGCMCICMGVHARFSAESVLRM